MADDARTTSYAPYARNNRRGKRVQVVRTIAGEHPDWGGALHEKPTFCDPGDCYMVKLREPVMTERGLLVEYSNRGNLYRSVYVPPRATGAGGD